MASQHDLVTALESVLLYDCTSAISLAVHLPYILFSSNSMYFLEEDDHDSALSLESSFVRIRRFLTSAIQLHSLRIPIILNGNIATIRLCKIQDMLSVRSHEALQPVKRVRA